MHSGGKIPPGTTTATTRCGLCGEVNTERKRTLTKPIEPEHPELDRRHAVRDESQAIGAFIDWLLTERRVHFMEWLSTEQEYDCPYQSGNYDRLVDTLRLEAELSGRDPEEIDMPNHPEDCTCKGTGVARSFSEGWVGAMPDRNNGGAINSWLAEYFDIDPNKIEHEERALLEYQRALNAEADRWALARHTHRPTYEYTRDPEGNTWTVTCECGGLNESGSTRQVVRDEYKFHKQNA